MFLRARGVDMLLAAVARLQLLTAVSLRVGAASWDIEHRTRGGLTGSQLALLLARVPIESTLLELADSLTSFGYDCDGYILKAACFVDHIYTVSSSISGATSAIEMILRHLRDVWHLDVKPDSKAYLPARGCPETPPVGELWVREQASLVLGWLLQNNGDCWKAWDRTLGKLWRAFFANSHLLCCRAAPIGKRLELLNSVVAHSLFWCSGVGT